MRYRDGDPYYRDSVPEGYTRVVCNQSGVLDVAPALGGKAWLVVEDGSSICSVVLSKKEIQDLIDHLIMVLVKE